MFKALRKRWACAHRVRHDAELAFHSSYCGLIFFEGHGLYATVGGILGVVIIINWFMGDA